MGKEVTKEEEPLFIGDRSEEEDDEKTVVLH